MGKDPVCGMDIDKKKCDFISYKGKKYYFCNPACKMAFEADPKQFVKHKKK